MVITLRGFHSLVLVLLSAASRAVSAEPFASLAVRVKMNHPGNTARRRMAKVVALCCAVLVCASQPAIAQQFLAQPCSIYRVGIPDFDQHRDGLLLNNGSSACVPTTGANWLAYIANHGYPDLPLDAPRIWQLQTNYDDVTDLIQFLGTLMHVDANGTGFGEYQAVMQFFFDLYYPGKFTVQHWGLDGDNIPSPLQLYDLMAMGGLVDMAFGNYNEVDSIYKRSAGHVVTLSAVYAACGGSPHIWIRNPNSDESPRDLFTQSIFTNDEYDLVPITGVFGTKDPSERTLWRRILHKDPSKISILDGIAVIYPAFAISGDGGHVTSNVSGGFTTGQQSVDYDLPGEASLLGLAQEPGKPYAIVLGGDVEQGTLWRLNLTDGQFDELGQFPRPGSMVFGRHGELYLFSDQTLLALDLNASPPQVVGARPGIDTPAAATYNNAAETLYLLTPDRSLIGMVRKDSSRFGLSYDQMNLPPGVDLPKQGGLSMSASPDGESLWIAAESTSTIFQLLISADGQLTLGEIVANQFIVDPRNLQATSYGTLLFTSGGVLSELEKDPTAGWKLVENVPFVGQHVGDYVAVSQPTTVPPEYSGEPSDRINVPPPDDAQPAACQADLNGDGAANHEDLRLFLAGFNPRKGHNRINGDFNGDGITDVGDLVDFQQALSDPTCLWRGGQLRR